MLKKVCAIICVLIGIAVIILGVTFSGEPAEYTSASGGTYYKAGDYSVRSATFGADFYTYIYGSTDAIVDELNEINHAAEKIVDGENDIRRAVSSDVEATNGVIRAINAAAKYLILALGLGILAFGLNAVGKAFEPISAPAHAAPLDAPVTPAPAHAAPLDAPVTPAPAQESIQEIDEESKAEDL